MIAALFVILTNGLVSVPPAQWQAVEIRVPQNGTTIDVDYEVRQGSRVQMLVLDRRQADRFHRGRSFESLVRTGFEKEGRLRYRVADAGEYVLMIDNRIEDRTASLVQLKVELIGPYSAEGRELSPQRRTVVVSLSLLFFGAVVAFSAWRFLRGASG